MEKKQYKAKSSSLYKDIKNNFDATTMHEPW